ncbi:hypothetical protein AVEN_21939-1 [Araneus ventricosus]|uniref:Uncharacterized protein n=1 Tax=Araneus ventricosus TaxID=182803 RepID=A0A4Y2D1R3_ARAVE|nr:hypothetical protein AVEN_21939-1 [Araneus ventricosus]
MQLRYKYTNNLRWSSDSADRDVLACFRISCRQRSPWSSDSAVRNVLAFLEDDVLVCLQIQCPKMCWLMAVFLVLQIQSLEYSGTFLHSRVDRSSMEKKKLLLIKTYLCVKDVLWYGD